MMSAASVSVVIPTFNGKHLLQKHLLSVLESARRGDEIVIVDDASTDGTLTWLKRRFKLQFEKELGAQLGMRKPELKIDLDDAGYQIYSGKFSRGSKKILIKVIKNLTNQRFAISSNRGFRQASNNLVFLLNSDVSPAKSCISVLVDTFNDQNIFAVGCLEYEGEDVTAQRSGKNKLWFERGLFQHSRANNFAFGATGWASGGSAMFDRKKWLELGGFDLKYQPAYWEDIDISFRAKESGYKVLFQPEAVVFHQHESTNAKVFSAYEMMLLGWRHSDYFTKKHANIWQKIAFYLWRPYWMRLRRQHGQAAQS